jgi:hypothetical protein
MMSLSEYSSKRCPRIRFCLILLLSGIGLGGCAVREQAFDCQGQTAGAPPEEFLMTPTSLRFQSNVYFFTEERVSLRIYTDKESGRTVEFNPSSGLLKLDFAQWVCKRIEL